MDRAYDYKIWIEKLFIEIEQALESIRRPELIMVLRKMGIHKARSYQAKKPYTNREFLLIRYVASLLYSSLLNTESRISDKWTKI